MVVTLGVLRWINSIMNCHIDYRITIAAEVVVVVVEKSDNRDNYSGDGIVNDGIARMGHIL